MEGGSCVLRLVLLCLVAVVPASAEGQEITAKPGDNVTLVCEAGDYVPFAVVDWSKSEGNAENVLVVARLNLVPKIQDNNYKGRLEMHITEKGEVHLTLKNVTEKDSGMYVCSAGKQTNRRRRDVIKPKPVSTIHLKVAPPVAGPPAPSGHGHIGLIVGLVGVSLVVLALLAVIWKKRKNVSPPHPHDEAVQTLQV